MKYKLQQVTVISTHFHVTSAWLLHNGKCHNHDFWIFKVTVRLTLFFQDFDAWFNTNSLVEEKQLVERLHSVSEKTGVHVCCIKEPFK